MKFLTLFISLLIISCASAKANKPNIIFILADDLGYGDLGSYGQKLIQTPELDKMANEGIRFTQHYVGSPVCAPSRAILMTGKHSGNTPVRGNRQHDRGIGQLPLPLSETTIAQVLQENGYRTAMIGKWGLGNADTIGNPLKRGFDEYFGYLDQVLAHNAFPEYLLKNDEKIYLDNEVKYIDPEAWHQGLGSYSTKKVDYSQDFFIEESLKFIEANQNQPFFLYLPWIIPHDNGEAPLGQRMEIPDDGIYTATSWEGDSKSYAATITRMDRDIGLIRKKLEELGIAENTLIMFSSDNGPVSDSAGYTAPFDSAGGLHGFKRDVYEGGIRVPLIATWPGTIEAGGATDHLSTFYDFFATLTDIAGIENPIETDGISYLPTLLGEEQKEHEFLYWEFPIGWPGNGFGFQTGVRMGKWKGVRVDLLNNPTAPIELYNLDEDPGEQNDLATRYPEIVQQIKEIMIREHTPSEFFPPVPLDF